MATPRQYTPDEDANLLALLQQGDATVFETLVWKYVKRIYNLAFLLSGDADFAAEASRNAFVAAHREIRSLRSTMHFSTWLVVLLLREYRSLLEFSEGNGRKVSRSAVDGVMGGGDDTPLQQELRRYIRSLPLEQGVVLVLHHVRGFGLDRIAEIVRIREDVLLSRLFMAQERLAMLLRQGTDSSGRAGDEEPFPHGEIRRSFSTYRDNSASESDKELIRRHLAGCGSCREALAQLEWIAEHLRKLPDIDPPPWLVPAVMESCRSELPVPSPPESPPTRGYHPFSQSMVILALIVATVVIYWYQVPHEGGSRQEKTVTPAVQPPPPARTGGTAGGGGGGAAVPLPLPSPGTAREERRTSRQETPPEALPPLPLPSASPPSGGKAPSAPVPRQPSPLAGKQASPPVKARVEAVPTLPADWGEPLPVRPPQRKAAPPRSHGSEATVLLGVGDHDDSQRDIERAVNSAGGTITGRGYGGGRTILYTRIDVDNLVGLMGGLARVGTLQELPHIPEGTSGIIDLTIRW